MAVFLSFQQWILMFATTSTFISGQQTMFKEDHTKNVFSIVEPEQEPYIYLQAQLEDIGERANLNYLTEKERIMEEKKLLSKDEVQEIIKKCTEFHTVSDCKMSLYRNYDGACNNRKHPKWGSSSFILERFMTPSYIGFNGLRKSVNGGDLPEARAISIKLREKEIILDKETKPMHVSAFFTFFGQIIAHDISLVPLMSKNGEGLDCCEPSEKNNTFCMSTFTKKNDSFYQKFQTPCLPFVRSVPYPICNFERRTPLNKQTSFLDASFIYGNSENLALSLRVFNGTGRLKTQSSKLDEILPQNEVQDALFCPHNETTNCFKAGDERVNQHTLLMALQTILLRFHNKIADSLLQLNPHWWGERIYQEARRIVVAVYQNIVYKEYLPWLIGIDFMEAYLLSIDNESLYDEEINPGTLVEFVSAAFRLHSMVPRKISKYHPHLKFLETYFYPNLIHDGISETLLTGSCEMDVRDNSPFLEADVVGNLYRQHREFYGFDMALIDIQRGRDQGLPPYVDIVRKCSKGKFNIRSFSDLGITISKDNIKLLQNIYKNVSDIDLWVGIVMESPINHAVVGFTASCLSAEQFHRWKYGDSYFFTHTNGRYPLTTNQLHSIKNYSLSQMMCQTGNIYIIRQHPFLIQSKDNYLVPCDSQASLNLMPWKDSQPTNI